VDPFGQPVEQILADLPPTALMLAAEDIELEAEPEEGKAAEIASAADAWFEAAKRAKEAERDANEAVAALAAAKEKLNQYMQTGATDTDTLAELRASIQTAEKQAAKMARRSAKTTVKATAAAKTVEEMGGQIPETFEEEPQSVNLGKD
jgi:hypothetical protein